MKTFINIIGGLSCGAILTVVICLTIGTIIQAPISESPILHHAMQYTVTVANDHECVCISDPFPNYTWTGTKMTQRLVRVNQRAFQRFDVVQGARFEVTQIVTPRTEHPENYVKALPLIN